MFGSPLAEHIGLGLTIIGGLLAIVGLARIFRVERADKLRYLRLVAIGVFLLSLNALRISLKVHWYAVSAYSIGGLVITAVAIAAAKNPSK